MTNRVADNKDAEDNIKNAAGKFDNLNKSINKTDLDPSQANRNNISTNKQRFVETMQLMQIDALMLLKFLAGRSEKSVQLGTSLQSMETTAKTEERSEFLKALSAVLVMPADELTSDTEKAAFLFDATDHLACLAAPATIETIKFTEAYVGASLYNVLLKTSDFKTKKLFFEKCIYFSIGITAVAVLISSIFLMSHIVSGQKIMHTLDGFRKEQSDLLSQMNGTLLPNQPQINQESYYEYFCNRKSNNGKYINEAQAKLCDHYNDLTKRMNLVYIGLRSWNSESILDIGASALLNNIIFRGYFIASVTGNADNSDVVSPEKGITDSVKLQVDAWKGTELSTEISIRKMSLYFVPSLLGFIGSAAYIFRRLSANIENHTLRPNESLQAILRIFLGSMLGSLVCLIFSTEGVTVSSLNFSLWLIAFLSGYAVQVAFNALDWIVKFLSKQLKGVTDV
jgi:hypothetical protein